MPLDHTNGVVHQKEKDGVLRGEGLLEPLRQANTGFNHKALLRTCLDSIRPAILTDTERTRPAHRRTAYLDGLRGFAALLVYIGHHQLWARDSINPNALLENGYGWNNQYYFATLPFVRTFFSGGHLSVCIFFAISGYVLSAKILGLIHAGDQPNILRSVSSAVFRRGPRLFLPVIGVTFIYFTFWYLFGVYPEYPVAKKTYWAELCNWADEIRNLTYLFRDTGIPWLSYNFHVWSIPVEFRGSLIIYVTLLTVSNWSMMTRLLAETGLIFYFMYIVNWPSGSVFISGLLLCDLDLLAAEGSLPNFLMRLSEFQSSIANVLFVVGLYLGGVPSANDDIENIRKTPGWYYLSFLKPRIQSEPKYFYLFWAALFLLFSIPRIPPIKAFFESKFCQYLGHISYMFYLIHGPVLWTLGDRFYAATGWVRTAHSKNLPHWVNAMPLSKAGPLGLDLAFLLPHLILLPLTFWLAEILTKLVDEPSVRFSQWLQSKVVAPETRRR